MKMSQETFEKIKRQLTRIAATDSFYAEKLKDFDLDAIQTPEDFEKLPFSEKADLIIKA